MGLNFPDLPSVGQVFPSPAIAGTPQWQWDGNEWKPWSSGSSVSALTLISTVTASNQASVVFNLTGYSRFKILADSIKTATASITFAVQISEDGGTTWKTTASYNHGAAYQQIGIASPSSVSTVGGPDIRPFGNLDLSTATSDILDITISKGAALSYTTIMWHAALGNSVGYYSLNGAGWWVGDTNPINAIRFLFNSGNILQGSFSLYGVSS
jgi:hypothetical protein